MAFIRDTDLVLTALKIQFCRGKKKTEECNSNPKKQACSSVSQKATGNSAVPGLISCSSGNGAVMPTGSLA